MNKSVMKKYAKLVVATGVNIKKGQGCIIGCSVDQHEFAVMVQEEAYKHGAKWVRIDWICQASTKLKYKKESLTTLSQVRTWEEEQAKYTVETLPALIRIVSDDPDGLKGVNPQKFQKCNIARSSVLKKYRDATEDKNQWTIVAVPSVKWAKKVFPNERASTAVAKLWDAILMACRVSKDNDPVSEWNEHNAKLTEKCNFLNSLDVDYLHFKNSLGTDFKCNMMKESIWKGGGDSLIDGTFYNPNMPTEEVFITPPKGKAEGTVVATKPLSYNGNLIDNFSVTFKDGKAVSWNAETGEDVLKGIITSDEGSCMLGEVALIPHNSPISNSNILFYNTLFDENASCHLALGRGYNSNIIGFEKMSKEDLDNVGVNDSIIHVDFMIGSPDMEIVARLRDGTDVKIFENGNWVK